MARADTATGTRHFSSSRRNVSTSGPTPSCARASSQSLTTPRPGQARTRSPSTVTRVKSSLRNTQPRRTSSYASVDLPAPDGPLSARAQAASGVATVAACSGSSPRWWTSEAPVLGRRDTARGARCRGACPARTRCAFLRSPARGIPTRGAAGCPASPSIGHPRVSLLGARAEATATGWSVAPGIPGTGGARGRRLVAHGHGVVSAHRIIGPSCRRGSRPRS